MTTDFDTARPVPTPLIYVEGNIKFLTLLELYQSAIDQHDMVWIALDFSLINLFYASKSRVIAFRSYKVRILSKSTR